jgi:O-antigen ligase
VIRGEHRLFLLAIVGVATANLALGSAIAVSHVQPAGLVAVLPAVLVVAAALIASNRAILVFGAFALDLSGIIALREPILGDSVYASDIILVLAIASWLAAWLIAPGGRRPTWPKTPILGWPLLVFAIFIGLGVVRGHELWGLSYLSQPVRFVIYAGIAAAVADMTVRQAWRGLTVVFYLGAVWNAAAAVFYLATGTVQWETGSRVSTGGTRVLTLTTALYLTGALVLALLNFEREHHIVHRLGHLVIGALATFGIVIAYGRGVWYAIAAVLVALFVTRRRLRTGVLALLPLCLPVLVLGGILIVQANPGFFPNIAERFTTIQSGRDASIGWRTAANDAVWDQVREQPIIGVGFGKEASFTVNFTSFDITQDPHNSFLFLWAGGGILTLSAFLLLFVLFLRDAWRRYRGTSAELPRALIAWCIAIWFCFVVNSLVEPQLTQANSILVFWILMLLPTIVPRPGSPASDAHGGLP